MTQFVLEIVYMSLVVLDLYKYCIILVSQSNWPCYVFLTLKWQPCIWHIKIFTNAWFSMKN